MAVANAAETARTWVSILGPDAEDVNGLEARLSESFLAVCSGMA
jgi:hypothetical protein